MSSLLSAELSATCNAIGNFNKKEGIYLIDDYTVNTVKDLIRYLRRDGQDHEIRRHLGQTKVLQTDLMPMLINHWENSELFDVTLRLIVNLTNPALLLYREEVPTERTARHNYLQILSHLQSYKEEAFTKIDTWKVFATKLKKNLEIDWTERDEDTGLTIERILILIRNVLHIPADLDEEKRPENDASIHDQVLWALNQSDILDILLYMSSENEKQYFMHILEIISHLLREQNPTSLADAALQRSVDEKLRDEQELVSLRRLETKRKLSNVNQYSASRHSLFGGTYIVQNMKSVSDNEIISFKLLNTISNLNFDGGKKSKLVKPKNRRPVETGLLERRSAFAVRLFLKEFCIEFLNSSYNSLMHYVKDVLVRAKAQQNDESYYLWGVKFFMEFNRGHSFQVGLVSETMSVPMFHYVQQQMEKYYDMIKAEKKKYAPWVRRLNLALRAYKELLMTLIAMEKDSDQSVIESAKVLKSNIFYVLEYRDFILNTFLNYDENIMPRSYLVDLLETVHLFLKMLQHYCKKTGLVVQKKVKKKDQAKKKKPHPVKNSVQTTVQGEYPAWEEVRAQLAAVLSSGVEEFPSPFDAASDVPIDQQREDCMKNIKKLLQTYKYEDAVGMFRAAREVWPEEGIFGVNGISEEEELNMLETVYNTDLGILPDEHNNAEESQHSEYDEEDEEDDGKTTSIVETDFDFQDFVQRFSHPKVVTACVYLLEGYDKNLPYTNHCIVKMLHRIAVDCKRPAMMFQASLFVVFQKILADPVPQFKELQMLAIYVFRKFTEVASKNPKTFIELLFWTNSKDALDIEYGYDLYTDSRDKVGKGLWSEEQEEELRRLYMENQANPDTDKDVIDWMLDNLIDQTRTRRSVIKKLKDLGLIFKAPTKRSNKVNAKERVPQEFTEDEDQLLRDLWEMYGDTADPMGAIMPRMPLKRQKRSFIDRMLELSIIQDKKECRKKRQKKSDGLNGAADDDISNGDTSDSETSDNSASNDGKTPSVRKKNLKKVQRNNKQSKENKKSKKRIELSANEIARLLVNAVDSGLTEGLTWLAETLEEVALDQEADGYDPTSEGVPLVPISKDAVDAIQNSLFKEILLGVGVEPPDNEQETFWRIPSSLHYETIRKRHDIILKAVNKELIVVDTADNLTINDTSREPLNENTPSNEANASSDDDDDLFNNLRKFRDNNIDMYSGSSKSSQNSAQVKNKRKRNDSIDTDDSDGRRKITKIQEVDEEQSDGEDIMAFVRRNLRCKDDLADTEDVETQIPKMDSDSESEQEDIVLSAKPNKKRRAVIEDDSD